MTLRIHRLTGENVFVEAALIAGGLIAVSFLAAYAFGWMFTGCRRATPADIAAEGGER